MRSKAHFKTHPLHPILVAFPIAFFIGTFLFDVLSLISGNTSFKTTAGYLNTAGIFFAIIAAVPGAIDYFFTVPPASSAKKRATQHALLNITVLLIFIISLALRQYADAYLFVSIVELIGVVLLIIAGWLGGTLVHRNQIGIDIRYANAGKWKEEYHNKKDKIKIADEDELELNQMKLVHVGGKRIVIGKTEKGYVAFDDRCTHKGGSLAGGSMICGTVQCPWHGSQFNTETGAVKAGPAKDNIQTYKLVIERKSVFLML